MGTTQVELQGDPSLTKSQVALKAMAKALRQGGEGVLIEFNHIGVEKNPNASRVPKDLEGIVQQFREVFEMPKGLPPVQGKEHAIMLKEGTCPVNVRPYCYP